MRMFSWPSRCLRFSGKTIPDRPGIGDTAVQIRQCTRLGFACLDRVYAVGATAEYTSPQTFWVGKETCLYFSHCVYLGSSVVSLRPHHYPIETRFVRSVWIENDRCIARDVRRQHHLPGIGAEVGSALH